MFLTDAEKAMRDGAEGPAVAAAMDLLLRYGAALDASRLCDIRNVAGTMTQPSPVKARLVEEDGWDKAFAVINLDSDGDFEVPADGGADVPAAARVRRRRAWYRALPEGEHRAPGQRRGLLRQARGEHPRHLHPVPGGQPAHARRALRVDGVLRGDLRQLGARRADQLRGDRLDRRRVADREDPLLGQPPGCEPVRDASGRRPGPGRQLPGLGHARLLRRRGRGRGPPGDHRRLSGSRT